MATTRGKSTHQLLPPAPRTAGLAEAKSTRQLSDAMAHRRTLDSPPDTNSLPEATYYKKKALKYRRNARFQSLLLAGLALFLLTSWAWTRLTDNDDKIRDRFHPVHARLLGLHPPQGSNLPLPHDLGKANLTERIRDYERFLVLKGRFATEGEDKANVTLAHFGWTLRDAGEALNLVDAFAEECHGGGDNAVKNREDLGIYVEEYLVKPWLREEGGLCGDGAVFEREICEYAIKRFRKQQNDFLGKSRWWWGW